MRDIRLWFSKTGEAKYISHLDLYRFMLRALKRTGLPVWHTEGFNPRIYVNFALPLSLGQCGEGEIMDIRLIEDVPFYEIIDKINKVLPPNIRIIKASEPINKAKLITSSLYEVVLPDAAEYFEKIENHLKSDKIIVSKKSKKGTTEINLSEQIIKYNITVKDNDIILVFELPTGTQNNINPSLIVDSINTVCECVFEPVLITRKQIYMQDNVIFE